VNNYIPNKIFVLSTFLILILPSLFFYIFQSLSQGIIIFSIFFLAFSFLIYPYYLKDFIFQTLIKFYFIFLFIIIHFLIIYLFVHESDFIRFATSYIVFIIYIISASFFSYLLVYKFDENKSKKFFKSIFYIIIFLCFLCILRYSALSPFYLHNYTYLTLFSEPSHFVITVSPFIFYFLVSEKDILKKFSLFLIFMALCLLIKSTTLLLLLLLSFIIIFSFKLILIIFFSFLFFTLIIYSLGFLEIFNQLISTDYYLDRLSLLSTYSNLKINNNFNFTALVYIANLYEVYLNLMETFFFGIGFQQFGITGETSVLRDLIYTKSGFFQYSASKDATFLAGKFISEFGIFGIFFLLLYFFLFIKNIYNIKKNKKFKKNHNLYLFFASIIISFSVELFVRGAGYFTSSTFLFLASVIGQQIIILNNEKKN